MEAVVHRLARSEKATIVVPMFRKRDNGLQFTGSLRSFNTFLSTPMRIQLRSSFFGGIMCRLILLCLLFVFSQASCAEGQRHQQFSVAGTAESEAINGQIDWPGGELAQWEGPVVVFISAGSPHDRNGWLVQAMETVWGGRMPLQELSAALVASGVAVVRFDNPGVRPPQFKCRETVLKAGLTKTALESRCMDTQVLANLTVERYQHSIENVLLHAEELIPAARDRLMLMGFSEGLMHAAAIADRKRIRAGGLISIGSPARPFYAATRWQAVERLLEIFPEFDINGDSIITNPEIRKRFKDGVGQVMGLNGWLSPYGQWDASNRDKFEALLEESYAGLLQRTDTGTAAGAMSWKRQANGVLVPDINDAFWNMHFHSRTAPVEVLQRLSLPGLFLWGGRDLQVSAAHEMEVVTKACEDHALPHLQYVRFDGRHHLLSKRRDLDWMEKDFMPVVAGEVKWFLDQIDKPDLVPAPNLMDTRSYLCKRRTSTNYVQSAL
jgi:pimeloyl-ACP methyl ester carboxylesterase